jgi:DNA-binding NarL/FixJ family response regulator
MSKITVMLASRPKMLSDVIRNIIAKQPDMVLIGDVVDPIKLLFATKQKAVDVVIVVPSRPNGEPKICSHLLTEHPLLKIITLSAKGDMAHLYQSGVSKVRINKPSADTIIDIIRKSMQKPIQRKEE